MKTVVISLALPIFFFSLSTWADSPKLEVDVALSPAGSFKAETNQVKGEAVQKGGKVAARGISVDLRTIETGISLRDKHLKERLMVDKYPEALLVQAIGENGKGKAQLKLKGMQLTVNGTYSISDKFLTAKFKIHLPDLKIQDVRYMGVGVEDDVTVSITVPIKDHSSTKAAQN